MTRRKNAWQAGPVVTLALMLILPALVPSRDLTSTAHAQETSRAFPETGKTVKGIFLDYWNKNGGLAQQGYPISDEMQEVSETDGRTYTVQYFERAVFELHPEERPEFQVLLSLLGVFYYNQKYPSGAPGQTPNNEAGSVLVPETGKRLGGVFLEYWRANGGLAQQGYPISDEFNEVSDLNGQTYKVQYFERAVFEFHPEEQDARFRVLLSQLGTFRYRAKYLQASPTAAVTAQPTTPSQPQATITPLPTASGSIDPPITPVPQPSNPNDCSGIPENVNARIDPTNCGSHSGPRGRGQGFSITGMGFTPGERVKICTVPPGRTDCAYGTSDTAFTDGTAGVEWGAQVGEPIGVWTVVMDGEQSRHRAIAYFKTLP